MANATPNRSGQANATGDALALFLKVFAGEVLTRFGETSAFRPRHMVRVIPNGKSATFPVTGLATAAYHTPGAEITGGTIRHGERIITIDDLLLSAVFIPNIDEAMNHFDVRSIYSGEIGEALALAYDVNVARTGIQNARGSAVITGLEGGATVNNASFDTDGTVLWNGIFHAGITLDEKRIPTEGREAFVRPVQYALLVKSDRPMDRDYNDANGSVAAGNIVRINNIPIVKTNNLAHANDTANTAIPTNRRADFSVTEALIQHRNAIGTVQLQDVTTESEYDIRRQGTLVLGKYLVGHGGLRPEAGVELRTADPAA